MKKEQPNLSGNTLDAQPTSAPDNNQETKPKSHRGFAAMDRALQRQIASKGGRAAHEKGTAHEFTPEEARIAGRKGGEAVSRDRAHMAEIGRGGGLARAEQRAQMAAQQNRAAAAQQQQNAIPANPDLPRVRESGGSF